jgi:hypothetical protein
MLYMVTTYILPFVQYCPKLAEPPHPSFVLVMFRSLFVARRRLGGHSSPTLSPFHEDKIDDFQYMARSPVAVDVQVAVGLGPLSISSLSWLPSR